jgi:hypothetical protein
MRTPEEQDEVVFYTKLTKEFSEHPRFWAEEILARLLWESYRQSIPGKGKGMTPPWFDRYSGQTHDFYQKSQTIIESIVEDADSFWNTPR